MKNIKNLFAICLLAMTLFACSSDDDSSNNTTQQNQERILGTWRFTSSTTNGTVDTDNDLCLTILTITFSSSQMTTIDVYGIDCESSDTYTNDYSISGNTISIEDEGEFYSAEILTLDSTSLIIEDEDGGDTYTETYTKQ